MTVTCSLKLPLLRADEGRRNDEVRDLGTVEQGTEIIAGLLVQLLDRLLFCASFDSINAVASLAICIAALAELPRL